MLRLRRIKTYWHIFWRFRSIQLMRLFEYRKDFIFWSLISTMWTIFNFFFFDLIIGVSGTIGGWNRYELYTLLGIFTMLDAFTWSFFYFNMKFYSQMVFNGEFNKVLLTPIDSQFILMTHYNSYNNVFRFFIGAGVLIWSLYKLHYQPSMTQIIQFLVLLMLSFLFLYTFWFSVTTLCFYFEKIDNINEIFPTIRRAWQVPRSVYTGIVSFIFTVLIPIGLITSIPAEILLGKESGLWVGYFASFVVLTFIFSRVFFKFSLKRYTGQAN